MWRYAWLDLTEPDAWRPAEFFDQNAFEESRKASAFTRIIDEPNWYVLAYKSTGPSLYSVLSPKRLFIAWKERSST